MILMFCGFYASDEEAFGIQDMLEECDDIAKRILQLDHEPAT